MGRDDLYITVPSFFKCPISLDVMKSPVSLCTGVTYDRSSIQRWLDSGNNTCPATMQVLQSKDLVPNHTLQRLIQIWSDSVRARTPPAESPTNSITQDQAFRLMHQLKLDLQNNQPHQAIYEPLSELSSFAKISDQNRSFLISSCPQLLALLISLLSEGPQKIPLLEKAVDLCKIMLEEYRSRGEEAPVQKLIDISPSMVRCLRQGSRDSRTATARLLELIISMDKDAKAIVSEKTQIYAELLKLVGSWKCNLEAMEAAISCLLSLATPKRNREKLVKAGAVGVLGKALSAEELRDSPTEKILRLMEMVSTCKEGRTELCGNEGCVQAIMKKVLKVSPQATEHAVTILWSLCCVFRDPRAQDAVAKSNGMAKILLLLQSNCSPAVRQMASDLLKVFRGNYKSSCLSSYETKTTHIMPF